MRSSPLIRATAGRSLPRTADGVDEVGEHRELDAGLAERRQHLLDVGEEQPVGPDDQHALVLEREPVRVEEVGGPVQRHDGLAGAGAALHDEHAGQRGPDDLVLLALDGGDDVAQPAGAGGLERRDQRAVAADAVVGARPAEPEGPLAEELVLDVQQGAAPGGEVAAAGQAHRLPPGGPVEGLGHRRPPVDDHRLLVLVGHRDAPDVVRLADGRRWPRSAWAPLPLAARLLVDAPEAERGVTEVELGEAVQDRVPDHVALEPGLLRAAPADLDHRLELVGPGPRLVEAVVGVVDVRLLRLKIGMDRQLAFPLPAPPRVVPIRGMGQSRGPCPPRHPALRCPGRRPPPGGRRAGRCAGGGPDPG